MLNHEPAPQSNESDRYLPFVVRSLIVLALVALALLLWRVREAVLLTFAAVLVAVVLSGAANWIRSWTDLSRSWSLVLAILAIGLLIASTGWLIGSTARDQMAELMRRLPDAIQTVEQRFGISVPGAEVIPDPQESQTTQKDERQADENSAGGTGFSLFDDLLAQLLSWGRFVLASAMGLILVIVAGIYLAASPENYNRGIVKLFPKAAHGRIAETLTTCGGALQTWLLTQLVAMALVGMMAALGTWLIGLPAPLALGLFAGVTEFVPVVGPIVGSVPALLIALTHSTPAFLWTLALFVGIQQLESNVITPLLERQTLKISPALFLFSVLAFGLLFGLLGILLAAPLTVVAYVAVEKLYMREALGEAVEEPGEE